MTMQQNEDPHIERSLQVLILRDGKPSLIFQSTVPLDVQIVNAVAERSRLPVRDGDDADPSYKKATLYDVPTNLSPVDQVMYEIDTLLFLHMFSAFSFYSPDALSALSGVSPRDLQVFLIILR